MATRRKTDSLWGLHGEDCECATCDLGRRPDFHRQQALAFERKTQERAKPKRSPRIEQTDELLAKLEASKANAAPPPDGGWRNFFKG